MCHISATIFRIVEQLACELSCKFGTGLVEIQSRTRDMAFALITSVLLQFAVKYKQLVTSYLQLRHIRSGCRGDRSGYPHPFLSYATANIAMNNERITAEYGADGIRRKRQTPKN